MTAPQLPEPLVPGEADLRGCHDPRDPLLALEVDLSRLTNSQKRGLRLRAARALGTHTDEQWRALCAEFDHRCVRCGLHGRRLERDHITPIYQGGSDGIDNLQPLCATCNSSKGPESANWVVYRRAHGSEECTA
jgi:5-methylcytosine-specific restriction endonuclease McrA